MLSTNDIIVSILSGVLSTIFMRIHDKFYNKQYTKTDYVKIGILSSVSTLCVLYISSVIGPSLPSNIKPVLSGGSNSSSNIVSGGSNNQNVVTKVASVLNDNLEYFNPNNSSHTMKFKTGTPNF